MELRRTLLLPLDDLLVITREFINLATSRSGLAAPMKIQQVLSDNGSQFTDRFTTKNKQASGQQAFDQACAAHAIEHRLAPPRR